MAGPGPAAEFIAPAPLAHFLGPALRYRTLHRHFHLAAPPHDVTEPGLRLLVSNNVDVTTIGVEPWEGTVEADLSRTFLNGRVADAGFSQVIDRGPDEVADYPTAAVDDLPVLIRLPREGLRAHHYAHRKAGMVLFVLHPLIVVAADAKVGECR